jgi:hypothetical protein
MSKLPMTQQLRKAHETLTVQRLTTWIGATALSLAGFFSVLAAKGAPVSFGFVPDANVQPQAAAGNQVNGALDDRIVVRRVYVPAVRPPAGGVKPGAQPGTAQAASAGQVTAVSSAAAPNTTTAASTSGASSTTSAPAPATPKPVAATGGSTPKH